MNACGGGGLPTGNNHTLPGCQVCFGAWGTTTRWVLLALHSNGSPVNSIFFSFAVLCWTAFENPTVI